MRKQYDIKKAAGKIRNWQKESGLKGKEIAKKAGISESYYSNISKGKQRGTIDVLARIADNFGKQVDDLFNPKEIKKKNHPRVSSIDNPKIKKGLKSLLGNQTEDFLTFYKLWAKSPNALKNALRVFHDTE